MNRIFVGLLVACFSLLAASYQATALSIAHISTPNSALDASVIVKIHSPQKVHDMLHYYGYDSVHYLSKRYAHDGKPIYKFRACDGRRAFHVLVDWYGDILHKHRAGRCQRRHW